MNIRGTFNSNSQRTILISVVLFCIFSFCLVNFLVIPSTKSIKQKSQEMIKKRLEVESILNKKLDSQTTGSKFRNFEDRVSVIDSNFMKKGDELDLIKILELTALQNGVTQTISPTISKDASIGSFYLMNLKLNISGSFKNVINYIQSIESLQYYINITSINMVKSQQKLSDDQNLQKLSSVLCTISAETYWK